MSLRFVRWFLAVLVVLVGVAVALSVMAWQKRRAQHERLLREQEAKVEELKRPLGPTPRSPEESRRIVEAYERAMRDRAASPARPDAGCNCVPTDPLCACD